MDNQKDQLAEAIRSSTNVLVTVSANPSVDQLAAAIGLTLLLNKMDKHATAVFSGKVPSTIEFLQPENTLEQNTDSLRDFIISLDKSKADKLRYKVEDKMVKIFITPYRTSISQEDLVFSQGDFNVDVVVAIGVHAREELDQAIISHGRILHDATVTSVNTQATGEMGSINWVIPGASSLCEMIVELVNVLKADALDGQMATALLTGIVAETERFSNQKTTAETMKISSQLMTAGANQQLVATKLEPIDQPVELEVSKPEKSEEKPPANDDGSLEIEHDSDQPEDTPEANQESSEVTETEPESAFVAELPDAPTEPDEPLEQIRIDEHGVLQPTMTMLPSMGETSKPILTPPTFGGKLTANTEPEHLDPANDPLSASPAPESPLLSHDSNLTPDPAPSQEPPQEPSNDNMPPTDQSQPSDDHSNDRKEDTQFVPPPPLPVLPEPVDAPSPPPLTPFTLPPEPEEPHQEPKTSEPVDQTIEDIEKAVESSHLQDAPETPTPDTPPEDSARVAVEQAISSDPTPPLEPFQALNAFPVDLNLPEVVSPETVSASDTPPVGDATFAPFPTLPVEPPPADPNPLATPPPPSMPPAMEVGSDPGLPPNLFGPAEPPKDITASPQSDSPQAPPPVPPPLMPPTS